MNRPLVLLALFTSPLLFAQVPSLATEQDISPARLESILSLPLGQAIEQRELYKEPLMAAYDRQLALMGKDCQEVDGQQPYNICMGKADERADADFALFYNNLQMLCHDQSQLASLQASQQSWKRYQQSAMQATHAAWPDGSGAPGFASQVHLSLLRDRMKELHEIFGLNIAQ